MTMKRLSISAVALLAGAVVGLPLTAARADEPATADQAEAAAKAARAQADHYRELGGVGYKAGLVQSSEAEATRYEAMAEKLEPTTPAVAEPGISESHEQAPVPFTYKTASAQQRAEMKPHAALEAQREAQVEAQGSGQTPNPSCQPTKPAVDVACKEQQNHQ